MIAFVLFAALGAVLCAGGLWWSHRSRQRFAGLWQFTWINLYLAAVFILADLCHGVIR
ncbi:MAG: hypothetical protein ACFCBW_04360 [Candidatus Competibacterales bacterium]